jgi:hypothetical protein
VAVELVPCDQAECGGGAPLVGRGPDEFPCRVLRLGIRRYLIPTADLLLTIGIEASAAG